MLNCVAADRILLYLLLLGPLLSMYGQSTTELDSLKQLTYSQEGEERIRHYIHIARHYNVTSSSPDSARKYAHLALTDAEKISDAYWISMSYLLLGNSFSDQVEFDSSGWHFDQALRHAESIQNLELISGAYNNRGTDWLMQDQYDHALEDFLASLKVEEQRGAEGDFQRVYGNIALTYASQGDFRTGIPYLYKALGLAKEVGDTLSMIQDHNNLASFYLQLNELDSAAIFANHMLEISRQAEYPQGIVRVGDLLSDIAFKRGEFNTSLEWTRASITIADSMFMPGRLELLYLNQARVYDTLGQYVEAIESIEESLANARQSGITRNIQEVLSLAARVYQHAEEYAVSLAYLKEAQHLKDSLFSVEKANQLHKLQTEFETTRKQQEIEDLEQKMEIQRLQIYQRSLLGIVLVCLAICSLGGLYLYNRQQILKEKQRAAEAKQQALRTQMNPHFLFHALSSIQDYLYSHEQAETATLYLAKFAKLMRLILENSREDLVSLSQEIQTLTNYMDLQQIRYQHGFSYELFLDPKIDPDQLLVPPMVAQPFIENALEHGRIHEQAHGKLYVQILLGDKQLEITVEDNGIGRKAAAAKTRDQNHRSLATEITEDRLQLIRRKYKQGVDLSITDKVLEGEVEGVRVFLALPLIVNER